MTSTAAIALSEKLYNHYDASWGFIHAAGCVSVSVYTWPHAFLDSVSKVEGNISGKSLRKTGRRNSIKGTMINTMKGTRRNRSAQVLISCKHRGDKCWRDKMWTVTQAPLSVLMTLKMCVWEYVWISITSALKLVSFKSSLNIALPFHVCTAWVMQSAHTYGKVHKPVTYNTVLFSQWSTVSFPK